MANIRNIIFDLGGVLYNSDQRLSIDALKTLVLIYLDQFLLEAGREQVFERFDRGELSPGDFRQALRKLSGLNVPDEQIDAAWNAMLLDFPEYRIDLLEGLRRHYRLFLLSNTNAIHYPHYQRYMQQTFGLDGLDHLFEKTYLSHQIGMRKPDAEVYEHIIKENELLPEETLFVDDTLQHVEGARGVGLKAVWLDLSKLKVTDLFNWRYQLRPEVAELL
jgi:putative hydrolase of the HAD superfamily